MARPPSSRLAGDGGNGGELDVDADPLENRFPHFRAMAAGFSLEVTLVDDLSTTAR
jgi:hypothetical protein